MAAAHERPASLGSSKTKDPPSIIIQGEFPWDPNSGPDTGMGSASGTRQRMKDGGEEGHWRKGDVYIYTFIINILAVAASQNSLGGGIREPPPKPCSLLGGRKAA